MVQFLVKRDDIDYRDDELCSEILYGLKWIIFLGDGIV
jgi:hypothetical protein